VPDLNPGLYHYGNDVANKIRALHNKPKAAVHPGQYADGPQKKKKKKYVHSVFMNVPRNYTCSSETNISRELRSAWLLRGE
jgi:hypothetical protein